MTGKNKSVTGRSWLFNTVGDGGTAQFKTDVELLGASTTSHCRAVGPKETQRG